MLASTLALALAMSLLLSAAAAQQPTAFGLTWVVAEYRESHAEACLRIGMAPTSTAVVLNDAEWDLASLERVASALGRRVAEHPVPSCCVGSMWCSEADRCYTHALDEHYINHGWLHGSLDRPVYTCEPPTTSSPTISKFAVNSKQKTALIVGSHLGRDNNAIAVSIAGDVCSSPDICTAVCQTCGAVRQRMDHFHYQVLRACM